MRLRTFIADSMAEAVDQVREAMGVDAIIVSSIEGENGGFEVTATLDQRAQDRPTPAPSEETVLEEILKEHLSASTKSVDTPHTHPAERADEQITQTAPKSVLSETSLLKVLEDQGVPAILASALTQQAMSAGIDDPTSALATALADRFSFDPLPIAPSHPIMAVGLPGHGKTVTIAKLAARAALENVHAQVVSTDAERTGAQAQAEAYGNLLQIPVHHAETVDAMGLVLDQRTDRMGVEAADRREACFIDTAAATLLTQEGRQTLQRQIDAGQQISGAEPVLVLAASGDARSMAETAQDFANLGVRRMIITQLDVSRRFGGILAAAEIAELSFAQFSDTPYLARGASAATPMRLAQMLLGQMVKAPLTEHNSPISAD
ncbi:hypothetical protein QMT40_002546 [Parvibaculaceae bacterium PLY_AMNH_Bact1]|nr:hypothetical protein QMT40_002546 [Parvibaculaceae bacterium PLY_AMNH_Bact1]